MMGFSGEIQRFALGNREWGIGNRIVVHGFGNLKVYSRTAQGSVSFKF